MLTFRVRLVMIRKAIIPLAAAVIACCVGNGAQETYGQTIGEQIIPKDAPEAFFVEKIERLDEVAQQAASTPPQRQRKMAAQELLLLHVDELLERYPSSTFRKKALVAKLRALANLARTNPAHLSQLLTVTGELAQSEVRGELAAENAFYAIQAFVLGARREGMPHKRRLQGKIERYRAFIEDYPESPHVPVIHASLIRNLLAADNTSPAMLEFSKLQLSHPDHAATRRAAGEVNLLKAVGRPFKRVFTTSEGQAIRMADHVGKVLVILFWESADRRSMDQVLELIKLYEQYHGKGLEVVGMNLDANTAQARKAVEEAKIPWLQYFEPKGSDSDIVTDTGIVSVPTCFVLDRKGILRNTNPAENLPTLVQQLLTDRQRRPNQSGTQTKPAPKTERSKGE